MIFKHPIDASNSLSDPTGAKPKTAQSNAISDWNKNRVSQGVISLSISRDSSATQRSPKRDPAAQEPPQSGEMRPMDRRKRVGPEVYQDIQPRLMRLAQPFRAGVLMSLRRLLIWLTSILGFCLATLWDVVLRRNTIERRARRLRETLGRIGGTFIKFGQQLSIRIDLVPYQYCVELTRLLDKADPFPTDQAIEIIEAQTGKPLLESFKVFDPTPIGAASIACVYQAELHTGEKVAVKVRRPGVGETMMADLRVLGWIFKLLEMLTIIRTGYTTNILQELRDTLLEELDFYKESRFQELFRRRAKKSGRSFFSAPRVFPEYSGEAVIVQEFIGGVWLSELIAAVEHDHGPTLDYIESLNIDPKLVARRLLWASHWGLWENIFFHADPHPANILVRPDSKLVFIDFGSSGTLTASRRLAMHELFAREAEEDLEGISRVALTLLEPLPPVDTEKVVQAIEKVFWDAMIAQRSAHSEWWEKTSANLWLGFFRVTNQFKIPMAVDHVRMIRATLLYDTLAARLDNEIDLGAQYRVFMKDAGNKKKRALQKKIRRRVTKGLTSTDYVKIDRLLKIGDQAMFLGQRLLNLRTFNFGALLGKLVSSLILLVTLGFGIAAATAGLVFATFLWQRSQGTDIFTLRDAVPIVTNNPWYLGTLAVVLLLNTRRLLLRLSDQEAR